MCGRYYIADDKDPVLALIEAGKLKGAHAAEAVLRGDVCPGSFAAVLCNDRALRPAYFAMRWGYSSGRSLIINARSETAAEKPLFRTDFRLHRCLIPAGGYYEWRREDRQKFRFRSPSEPLLLAGLYRIFEGLPEFVILTREAPAAFSFIHSRMPVLLPEACQNGWLDPQQDPRPLLEAARTELCFEEAV